MLPSDFSPEKQARQRFLQREQDMRERVTRDSVLGVEKQGNGTYALFRLENDAPGASGVRLEVNLPNLQTALKAARRVATRTQEDTKVIRD